MAPSRGLLAAGVAWALVIVLALVTADSGAGLVVAEIANMAIFAGYLFVALFLAPYVRARLLVTKIAGSIFFFTCGLTHLEHFLHALTGARQDYADILHLLNSTIQAVSVLAFAIALWVEFIGGAREWPPRLDFARMFGRRREDG